MSEKKPTLEELAERIDQLLAVLREISEDLVDISKDLKSVVAPTPAPAPSTPSSLVARIRSVADIRTMFPKELEDMLLFEEEEEYISAGRDSHFRVPRELK